MPNIKNDLYKYLLPSLLETQRTSFCWFLEFGFIQELENFPILHNALSETELHLSSRLYRILKPKYSLLEAKRRGTTYSVSVYTFGKLLYLKSQQKSRSEVFLCENPSS